MWLLKDFIDRRFVGKHTRVISRMK